MTEPLNNFKHLVVHPAPGVHEGARRVPVTITAAAAVFVADMLCQGYRAGHTGLEIHVFHPAALGTVPLEFWAVFVPPRSAPRAGPGGPPGETNRHYLERSHGPNPSQPVPTPGGTASNVVPIDAAMMRRGTTGGRP